MQARKLTLFTIVFLFFNATALGASGEKYIYVNGIPLDVPLIPVKQNDTVYVPLRPIMDVLGYEIQFNNEDNTISMENAGEKVQLTLENEETHHNGNVLQLASPPFILNGNTYVPIELYSAILGHSAEWRDLDGAIETVWLYTPNPVSIPGSQLQVSTQIFTYENKNVPEPDRAYADYLIRAPQFHGFTDGPFQEQLNQSLLAEAEMLIESIKDAEAGMAEYDTYYRANEDWLFEIKNTDSGLLSFLFFGSSYYGGAHGLEYILSYNIDLNRNQYLTLADLFQDDAPYELTLIDLVNAQLAEEKDDLFSYPVEELLGENFYMEQNHLVLYYPPYAIAPYARGFVEIRAPLTELAGMLREEYEF